MIGVSTGKIFAEYERNETMIKMNVKWDDNPLQTDNEYLSYVLAFGNPVDPLVYIINAVSESLVVPCLSFNGSFLKVVPSFPNCSNFANGIFSPKTFESYWLPVFYQKQLADVT